MKFVKPHYILDAKNEDDWWLPAISFSNGAAHFYDNETCYLPLNWFFVVWKFQ